MRRSAGRCDHHFQAALASRRCPLHHAPRIAVSRAHLDLVLDPELVEDLDARFHQRQVGLGAEDDANNCAQLTASPAISDLKKAPSNRTRRAPASAFSRASATVSPSATDVTTRPPLVTSPRPRSKRVPAWKMSTPGGISARPRMGSPVFMAASSG